MEAANTQRVRLADPPRANLLALLMRGLIDGRLADPAMRGKLAKLELKIGVTAGRMQVTLALKNGEVVIENGIGEKLNAQVSGPMGALLAIVTGGGLIMPVITGVIRIKGNPFALLKILPFIQAAGDTAPDDPTTENEERRND